MKKYLEIGVLLILILYWTKFGLIPAWNNINSDFPNYYVSSKVLIEGKNTDLFYNDNWFNSEIRKNGIDQIGRFSPFPPVTAFVMLPVAMFKPMTAKRIWTIINIGALVLMVLLLKRATGWSWIFSSIFVFLAGQGLANNFKLGQLYLVFSCLIVLSYLLVKKDKNIIAGVILGIVASIKYFPIVFVLCFAFNKNYRLVVSSFITICIIFIIEYITFGPQLIHTYIFEVLTNHLNGELSMQSPFATAFQSWESFLRNLFIYDESQNPNPMINWPEGLTIVKYSIYSIALGSILYVIWIYRRVEKGKQLNLYLSLIGIALFTLLPASATYHYLFLIFPLALFLIQIKGKVSSISFGYIITLYTLIGFLPWGKFYNLGEGVISLFLSYPRLWIINLLYVSCFLIALLKHKKDYLISK